MRIAFISEVWHPSVNGIVTRLDATIGELLAHGHQVLMIAPRMEGTDAAAPPPDGLTVVRAPSFRIGFIYGGQPWGSPVARVTATLRDFAPDLVHLVSPFMLGIPGMLAARRLRLPLVASFHTDIAAYARSYHLRWSVPVIWGVLRWLHNAADLNLVTSHRSEALLAEHGIRGIARWRPGFDLALFRGSGTDRSRDRKRPIALCVGRLAHEKRLDALVPLARSGRVRLELVGDGPDRDRLESEFAGTDAVFLGTLTGADLAAAYARADVFVFTSTTETLGLVIIEALASGLPVVAAESPASRELLGGRSVARLIPADRPELYEPAVDELLASGTATERSAVARSLVADWSWADATRGLVDSYESVLSTCRTNPHSAAVRADVRAVRARPRRDRSPSSR